MKINLSTVTEREHFHDLFRATPEEVLPKVFDRVVSPEPEALDRFQIRAKKQYPITDLVMSTWLQHMTAANQKWRPFA